MGIQQILMCLMCAVATAAGQLLFKLASSRMGSSGSPLDLRVAPILALSFVVYFITSLAWVWVLRSVPLSRAYAVLSSVYLMVPIGATLFFHERLTGVFWLGASLICAGIVLTASAAAN
jgi:drug/metabolite transporter (DMT)-like permease